MPEPKRTVYIHRKEAVTMDQLVSAYIKQMKLAAGLNTQRIFEAWDACSGACPYTLRRYFRGGKLYITLSSSVIRNQLLFQKDALVEKMNQYLAQDPLFTKDNNTVGYIQTLVLK
jgi:hypothetical protein